MTLSVVIPCYNEKENLPLLLERFSQVITEDITVVLVDNGSTDGSAEVFRALLPDRPFARLVMVEVNQGYGYGILQGLRSCGTDYIGWTHADLQTDPADVVRAWELVKSRQGRDVYIKGNREGRPLTDEFFTFGMGVFETFYLGHRLSDINAQPNLFPRTFFESWKNPPYDFALDLYAAYMAGERGLEMVRFPVRFPERLHGESKWNTGLGSKWKFIKRTIGFSRKLKREGIC